MLNVIINPKHRRLSLPSRLSVPLTAQKDREYHLSDVCVNDSPLTRARGEDQIGDWISWAASCHSNRPRPHVFIAISLNIIWMSELYKTCHEEINFDRNPTLPAPPPPETPPPALSWWTSPYQMAASLSPSRYDWLTISRKACGSSLIGCAESASTASMSTCTPGNTHTQMHTHTHTRTHTH